jgi:hypothetical protein
MRRHPPHHLSPARAKHPAGLDSEARLSARVGDTTAPFPREFQSFLDNLIAGLAQIRSWNDPMTSSYYCLPFGLARNVQFVSELFARAI